MGRFNIKWINRYSPKQGPYKIAQDRPLEILLSPLQLDFINRILPPGFSLHFSIKHDKRKKDHPQNKKLQNFSNSTTGTAQKRSRVPKKFEQDKAQTIKSWDDQLRRSYKILQLLKKHQKAYPFLYPVDPVALNIPQYPTIITEPMDLSTVEDTFLSGQYATANQFKGDINKIWLNSYKVNPRGSQIYQLTVQMEKYYKKISQEIQSQPKKFKAQKDLFDVPMSIMQKRQLGQNIRKLDSSFLQGVVAIVSNSDGHSNMLEFDIDSLSVRKTRELQEYVNSKLRIQGHQHKVIQRKPQQQAEESSFSLTQS